MIRPGLARGQALRPPRSLYHEGPVINCIYNKDVEEGTASRGSRGGPGTASVNLHLFLQWNGGIHSLSQNPTELRAPVFDGLEASSGSTELAPSVPRR